MTKFKPIKIHDRQLDQLWVIRFKLIEVMNEVDRAIDECMRINKPVDDISKV